MSNGNGDQTPDWDSVLYEAATTPRRISVDGVDYSGRSAQELLALKKDSGQDAAFCKGFRAVKRQVASPPSALGIHLGRSCPGGRVL